MARRCQGLRSDREIVAGCMLLHIHVTNFLIFRIALEYRRAERSECWWSRFLAIASHYASKVAYESCPLSLTAC